MSVSLDVGSDRLRSLHCRDGRLVGRSCRAVYAALADTDVHRQALTQMRIPFAVCDEDLVLIGDTAYEYAGLFRAPLAPVLPAGKLPLADAPARQILATHEDALHRIAAALIERESLDADEVKEILSDVPKWEHAEGTMRLRAPEGVNAIHGGIAARSDGDN